MWDPHYEPIVIECWEGILTKCAERPPINLIAGQTIYHGARRERGEFEQRGNNWLWADHWYSLNRNTAESYARAVEHAPISRFLTVEPFRNLQLLDTTGVSFLNMCVEARSAYQIGAVGQGDLPIRLHMNKTMKHYLGDRFHGYTEHDFNEIFILDFYHNLVISKEELSPVNNW